MAGLFSGGLIHIHFLGLPSVSFIHRVPVPVSLSAQFPVPVVEVPRGTDQFHGQRHIIGYFVFPSRAVSRDLSFRSLPVRPCANIPRLLHASPYCFTVLLSVQNSRVLRALRWPKRVLKLREFRTALCPLSDVSQHPCGVRANTDATRPRPCEVCFPRPVETL
jgi:hypothetical protein